MSTGKGWVDVGRKRLVIFLLVISVWIVFTGCPSAPAVIDTSPIDAIAVDLAGTAGTIETQTVTVYETVTKLIYQASPEDRAKVEREFNELRASITHLKTIAPELARVHAVEAGKLASEIARLQAIEPKYERVKGQRNTLAFGCIPLILIIGVGLFVRIKGFP